MSWKVTGVVEERHRFVLRALAPGGCVSRLCGEFGISRKTGYKWIKRFREQGIPGLNDLSRRPRSCSFETPGYMVAEVARLRGLHPSWGPKKLRALLLRAYSRSEVPALSTIALILRRCGLAHGLRARRPKRIPEQPGVVTPKSPNELWTVDYKGWWKTADGCRCEPLTIRDAFSRFLLDIRLTPNYSMEVVREVFERIFTQYGLPEGILSDNGAPFACIRSLGRFTKLSAWWRAMGIRTFHTEPGKPYQNGAHERMHRDMRRELQWHAQRNLKSQQEAIDAWRAEFNLERPHEALDMKTPREVYSLSLVPYVRTAPQIHYPECFQTRLVHGNGTIRFNNAERFVSQSLANWPVGLRCQDHMLEVWFSDVLLGTTNATFTRPIRPCQAT